LSPTFPKIAFAFPVSSSLGGGMGGGTPAGFHTRLAPTKLQLTSSSNHSPQLRNQGASRTAPLSTPTMTSNKIWDSIRGRKAIARLVVFTGPISALGEYLETSTYVDQFEPGSVCRAWRGMHDEGNSLLRFQTLHPR
jgi:hypothetical protein